MLTRGLASTRLTPLLGLGGGLLTSFPMVDGEIVVLEGMVEARDRLLQSGEPSAILGRWTRSQLSPVGNAVPLPLGCHCVSAHRPLKSEICHRDRHAA